jgi:hypothetical protein
LAIGLFVGGLLVLGILRYASLRPPANIETHSAGSSNLPAESAQSPNRTEPIPESRNAGDPLTTLSAQLGNAALSAKARRQAARDLARNGSDESITALKRALPGAPAFLRTAIAESLGGSPNAQARPLLLELVDGRDEAAARGAVRGLGARGDAEAAEVLSNLLMNPAKSVNLRIEAANALAEVDQPASLAALSQAARQLSDPELVSAALEAIGQRPFAETQDFFRDYLSSPGLSSEAKVAALEALGNSTGDVAALLLKFTADPSAEVRAAAAWGLSATESATDLGEQLAGLLKGESDSEVRLRLYEALAGQQKYDRAAVLPLVENEADPAARLAGLVLLGDWVRTAPTADVLGYFNQTAIPELKNTALHDPSPASRLTSVMTLRRAATPEAGQALQEIGRLSTDPRTAHAANSATQVRTQ